MSTDVDAIIIQEDKKSLDKKEIEVEEREKMLNEENKATEEAPKQEPEPAEVIKPAAETVVEEGREVKPKFIPIGGIKMPGFFTRSKSREKCKDSDDGAQGELLAKPPGDEAGKDAEEKETAAKKNIFSNPLKSLKITNPFAIKPKQQEAAEETPKPTDTSNQSGTAPPKKGLLNAIRLPLANMTNMIPRKLRGHDQNQDAEIGLDTTKQAELASMETLDDNKDTVDKTEIKTDDGMETVKLDVEDKTDAGEEENKEKLHWRERIRQQKFIIDDIAIAGGILLFIILLIIIIAITASGGKNTLRVSPLKEGKYVDAVTSCGIVEGILEDGAYAFRGIPYAVPPVGENRWRNAQPLNKISSCWNGTLKAHNSTSLCLQVYQNGSIDGVEDCLTLDVITPDVRYDNPLPVIVLIGSNTMIGGSPGKLRPSTRYARSKDVVFVRPNFRVGALGFLSLEVLSMSSYPRRSGNYGLSDIIAALNWVQLNIKHFGGDPTAVTIFGHRAGGTLVTSLFSYPHHKKLFARAWVSSGSASFPDKPVEDNESANLAYLNLTPCKDAACLRNLTANDTIKFVPDTWRSATPDLPSVDEVPDNRHKWLVQDGLIISKSVHESLIQSDVPLIIGATAHESASEKLFLKYETWTPELITKHVNDSALGKLGVADEALKKYNATYQGLVSMISDIRTICPLLNLTRVKSSTPFYIVTQGAGDDNIADVDTDISAIMGRYEPKTPEQRRYVAAMQQLFYHYVWHGKVPQATIKNYHLVLEVGQDVLPRRDYENCEFWMQKGILPQYARQD